VHAAGLDFEQCYRAIESRDARFDGWFVVGVRTTGVYCRPSCPSPVCPKRQNVAFFRTAAAAQLAGLRACKRCRPDAIPGSPDWDARGDLVGRAMRLIADGVVDRDGVSGLARALAVSERQLHRLLVEGVGAPPLALARAQRAQTARVLIETTELPFADIAFASGFASIRQFNETVRRVFASSPTELRRARRRGDHSEPGWLSLRLPLRAPYDCGGVLAWLAARAVPGVEAAPNGSYRRTLSLPGGIGVVSLEPQDDHVRASLRLDTFADLGVAVARCRRLLDLDADPAAYEPVLASDDALARPVAARPGLRTPGTVDGEESAIRAVLGQQITIGAARTIAARLVAAFGPQLARSEQGVTHAFPPRSRACRSRPRRGPAAALSQRDRSRAGAAARGRGPRPRPGRRSLRGAPAAARDSGRRRLDRRLHRDARPRRPRRVPGRRPRLAACRGRPGPARQPGRARGSRRALATLAELRSAPSVGGRGMRLRRLETPVGRLTVVASDRGLRAVLFPRETPPDGAVEGDSSLLSAVETQLAEYFAGGRTVFELPLDVVGTEFQRRAWLALAAIPYGTTVSYGEQARRLGRPGAARAVGAANGRNPVSIVLPCHRVVGADGRLTGYGGGLDAKRALLEHEARVLARTPSRDRTCPARG
jgi:AraC family transcriptional regulator of adaptative response / DNA-3-methyladenine glycosylase II